MSALLAVRGLNKSFGSVVAANNIEVEIAASEIVGIIGANGAGKTTLFRMITGDEKPDAGKISLGESVKQAKLLKWHKHDGDAVKTDEPLCELETDKANVPLNSSAAGVIQQLKNEGDTVKVGEVVARPAQELAPRRRPLMVRQAGDGCGVSSVGHVSVS